jgi:hypothetical protein
MNSAGPAPIPLFNPTDIGPEGSSLPVGSRDGFAAIAKNPVILNRSGIGCARYKRKTGFVTAHQDANLLSSSRSLGVQFPNRALSEVNHEIMVVPWILIKVR